jgi:GTP-binding protein Era
MTDPTEEDRQIASLLPHRVPLLLVLNKMDLVSADALAARRATYQALLTREAELLSISATRGDGLPDLLAQLSAWLPIREPEFDSEQVTDLYEKEIAADLIREAALLRLRDEVPHGVAVRIDEFKERENGMAYVAATIFIERESQKGIIIGEGGKMLKAIGSAARAQMESMGGHRIYLELRVKVLKDWRNDPEWLRRFGYKLGGKKERKKRK